MASNNYDLFFSFEKMLVFNQKNLKLNSNEISLLISIYHFDRSVNNFQSIEDMVNMTKKEFESTLLKLSSRGLINTDTTLNSNISLSKLVNSMKEDIVNQLITSSTLNYFKKLELIIKEPIMPEEEKAFFKLLSSENNTIVIALINKSINSNVKILDFSAFIDELKSITNAEENLKSIDDSIDYNWIS